MTYERAVGRRLKEWLGRGELHGQLVSAQWFNFQDENGFGFCQVDHLLILKDFVIILECKLTQTQNAHIQLLQLYKPVVEKVYGRPAVLVQVCKNLYHIPPGGLVECISRVIDNPRTGFIYTWHFLGNYI